jgi:hypothetical protein
VIIIVKNIKSGINIDNIVSFIKPAMKNRLFNRAEIESLKIIKLVDKDKRTVERYGIIYIAKDPEKKVLHQLKSRVKNKGNDQRVDEYIIRLWSNDRRTYNVESLVHPKDRRKLDRRRGLKIETVIEKPSVSITKELERNAILHSACAWDTVPQRRASL